jgi:hypothetical protein
MALEPDQAHRDDANGLNGDNANGLNGGAA